MTVLARAVGGRLVSRGSLEAKRHSVPNDAAYFGMTLPQILIEASALTLWIAQHGMTLLLIRPSHAGPVEDASDEADRLSRVWTYIGLSDHCAR